MIGSFLKKIQQTNQTPSTGPYKNFTSAVIYTISRYQSQNRF